MQTCEDLNGIYTVSWVIFTLIAAACWLLGSHRGSPLKRTNFHVVTVGYYFVNAFYGLGASSAFCTIDSAANPGELDFSLTRILVFGTLATVCSALITCRLNESTIDIIIHISLSVASQIAFYMAIVSTRNRISWFVSAVWTSVALCLHMFSEARIAHCTNSRFAMALLWSFIIYNILYYGVVFSGPWFADIISLYTQEIILLIVDCLFGARICYALEHYGWSQAKVSYQITVPDEISSASPEYIEKIVTVIHTSS